MNRGVVGIAVLWILTALSAVAFAVIAIGRWHSSRGRSHIEQTRVLYLVKGAALLAWDSDFAFSERTFSFADGHVRIERDGDPKKDELTLRCEASHGNTLKRVEIGWRRTGGQWRAQTWREL